MLYLRMARVRKQRIIDVVTHPEMKKSSLFDSSAFIQYFLYLYIISQPSNNAGKSLWFIIYVILLLFLEYTSLTNISLILRLWIQCDLKSELQYNKLFVQLNKSLIWYIARLKYLVIFHDILLLFCITMYSHTTRSFMYIRTKKYLKH